MRKNTLFPVILILFITTTCLTEVKAQLDLPRGSQMAKVSQRIGITDLTVVYSRPSVRERQIWGSVVPYGMNNLGFGTAEESPWRAGANENTIFKVSDDITVEGKPLAAGKYGLHLVIHEDDRATVIFNKNSGAWGSYFYDPALDALKVDVETEEIAHTEQLTFTIDDVTPNSATVALNWEKKRIPFTVEVDVPSVVMADIRQKLQDSPGFNRQTWEQAANFAMNNEEYDQALEWVNQAISAPFMGKKTFNNLQLKARVLMAQGKEAEAEAIMDEAVTMGTVFEVHGLGRAMIRQGKKEKAMEIFKTNAKMHAKTWPVDYGLARGYSAMGNYKSALKHLKIAADRAPDELNKNAIAANITKLENGEDIN